MGRSLRRDSGPVNLRIASLPGLGVAHSADWKRRSNCPWVAAARTGVPAVTALFLREIQDQQQPAAGDLAVLSRGPGPKDDAEKLALSRVMPPVSIELLRWLSGDQTSSGWTRWRLISAGTSVLIALPAKRKRLSGPFLAEKWSDPCSLISGPAATLISHLSPNPKNETS